MNASRFLYPLIALGAFLILIGVVTLVSRFRGGFMAEGLWRHGCWMIASLTIMGGVGCIAQALGWNGGEGVDRS